MRPFDLLSDQAMSEFEADLRQRAQDRGETPGLAQTAQAMRAGQPTAQKVFDADALLNAPVIAGDQVAEYCASFAPETDPGDVVSVLAPPFDRFFVDFQGVANSWLNAWGVLFETWMKGSEEDEIRWHLGATLIIEPRKGHPIGPAANWILALDQEGRWLQNPDTPTTEYVSGLWLPPMSEELPEEVSQHFLGHTLALVLPALMTISFMHCRNVEAREVEPPELLSRKWRKRRGRPLLRYHVLDIGPMRSVLDQQGEARSKGLGHAVHICRGHFKTFTEEAPLFGRVTGQFWWADQVRGRRDHGAVVKDYRVALDQPSLGRPYAQADEEATVAPPERTVFDPDAAGRGRQAHNRTQNALAQEVQRAGRSPRQPGPHDPKYDLAWESGEEIVVAEIKSLTEANEERQLRIAIGQVVRYRHQLGLGGHRVQAMIAVERAPQDDSWLDLCNEQGIILAWPALFAEAVRSAGAVKEPQRL